MSKCKRNGVTYKRHQWVPGGVKKVEAAGGLEVANRVEVLALAICKACGEKRVAIEQLEVSQ